ncbi:hypothetical protein QNI16_23660 [Cytophagaceae bacterium YF14B1]|uniref:Uncharacterized protein n=1 Tax=Xanthocytophaga flava TaxID=3048013 RepID=A0AAE3QU53_9BACT|nr:hypothetical protein [Xanthocytophaga flavus]MDJ1483515.1 hypothetical protein [Xanthocytophaga flavus]
MTHQQILDKLAAKYLVQSIDDDISRLTWYAMAYDKQGNQQSHLAYILPKLLLRWNCILHADSKEVSEHYKQKAVLALAVILHKYGFADTLLTQHAIRAIDQLNQEVVLSDDFFRKSEEIKKLISGSPVALKRKPAMPDSITFYRPKDVVSIQLERKFYAAYIHNLTGPNEAPIIEFYEGEFDSIPTVQDLYNRKAKGQRYNDGKERIARFAIYGMKYMPDLANQIQLIGACIESAPENEHLTASVGLYTMSDLFDIQSDIQQMFR